MVFALLYLGFGIVMLVAMLFRIRAYNRWSRDEINSLIRMTEGYKAYTAKMELKYKELIK